MGHMTINKGFFAGLLALALLASGGALAAPEAKNPGMRDASLRYDIERPHKMTLHYDVYAGGFKALDASLDMDLDPNAYDMKLRAETQGFIAQLFPWEASYNTSGHAEEGQLMPSVYLSRSSWRGKEKTLEMDYGPGGRLLKSTTQEGDKTTVVRDIDDKLSGNAADMLTSALAMLQSVRHTEKCEGRFPVFDGKRRYNIVLKDEGADTIRPSEYSSFSGEALRCTLTVEPVAGFKPKDKKRGWMAVQSHTQAHNRLPTLWLARLDNTDQMVPVRMEIASDYGSVVAHLTGRTN
jgi:hypothetical protein